nr:polysialyltransferase family glycosyltransferase [uncultured Flavobacterium sp.]
MKTVFFIFSSPLQFLFSSLISQKLDKEFIIKGYYHNYGKDFSSFYSEISAYLSSPIRDINLFSSLDVNLVKADDFVFFSNRFNVKEIDFFIKVKKNTKNLFLYEEGLNTYIPHHYTEVRLSDNNFKTSIKNTLKKIAGKSPSLIKLNQFKSIYSTLPIEHLKDQSKSRRIEFLSSKNEFSNDFDSCLFLSQTLVEDGLVNEDLYVSFMKTVINKLSNVYETIYFKPHPRNTDCLINKIVSNNSKIKLLPAMYQNMPAEVYLTKNKLDLYSISSSTLIYGSSLLGINSFQCFDFLIKFQSFQSTAKLLDLRQSCELIFAKHQIKTFL